MGEAQFVHPPLLIAAEALELRGLKPNAPVKRHVTMAADCLAIFETPRCRAE